MREILQVQAGQCGNQIGTKVSTISMFMWSSHTTIHDYFVAEEMRFCAESKLDKKWK